MNLPSSTLATFEDWEKPTLQNVVDVFEKLKISDENFTLSLGLNTRTYRRWTSMRTINRFEKSPIPYGVWCVLIALSENKYIFGRVLQHDKTKVPASYIFSIENFVSPSKEILTGFVGKKSITGLHRTELAKLFGWSPAYLGREFNNGNISFLNWALLLLLCGVSVGQLIKIKPTGQKNKLNEAIRCLYCNGVDGYYYRVIESRSLFLFWDGEPDGGSEPDTIRGMEKRYCRNCDKDVTKKIDKPIGEFECRE